LMNPTINFWSICCSR